MLEKDFHQNSDRPLQVIFLRFYVKIFSIVAFYIKFCSLAPCLLLTFGRTMWCTQENAIVPVHLFEGHVIAGITRCRSGGNASERRSYCINKSRQNARGRRFRCLIVEDRRISYCPRSRFAVKLNALTFAYFFQISCAQSVLRNHDKKLSYH